MSYYDSLKIYNAKADRGGDRHYELNPAAYDFKAADTLFTGLGVGVLIGAAVSLSPSVGELAARGVEIVRIAFRCAMHVDRVARTLDTFDQGFTHKNWIYVVLNEPEQRVRDELEVAQPSHVSKLSRGFPDIQFVDF